MKLVETKLSGVYIIENNKLTDKRGAFIKTFNEDDFKKNGLCTNYSESYFSISSKNVIRGMHFQSPPYDHEKLVYVTHGSIIDIILDIRKESVTYGEYIEVELSQENAKSVYIPRGLAHGFKSLEEGTITVYSVSTVYEKESDCGILWSSFGYDWKISEPILSDRDRSFIKLGDYKSNFY